MSESCGGVQLLEWPMCGQQVICPGLASETWRKVCGHIFYLKIQNISGNLHLFLACSTSVPQLSSYRHSCVPSWLIIAPGITGLCTNQRKMSYMCRWQTGGFSSWSKYSRTKKEGEQMLCKKLNHVKNVQYNRFVQDYGDEGMVVLKENFGTILNISDCFPEQ